MGSPVSPHLEHDPSPVQPGPVSDSQRFVLQVCLNKPSAAFLSDQRESLPRSLTALPSATGGARSVQALLGFPKEATQLQQRLFPRVSWGECSSGGTLWPRARPMPCPGPPQGLIRLGRPSRPWRVRPAAAGGRGRAGRAGRQPRVRGDSSAGRLLLGRIPPRRDEPPVTRLGGRGRPPPVRAGPSLSPGLNSLSPPDPLFNSHTCTKA